MSATATPPATDSGLELFARILVGVDGSQEALEAARQAAALAGDSGQLTLLSVWNVLQPSSGGVGRSELYELDRRLEESYAHHGLAHACAVVARGTSPVGKVVRGAGAEQLLREAALERHTLVAVGWKDLGGLRTIVESSTATEVVHGAPCSVLVARTPAGSFPRRLVVGIDGSPESAAAYAIGRSLADRFRTELTAIVATGGKGVDHREVAAITAAHELMPGDPVDALVERSGAGDLVLVGSRGVHGAGSLGTVAATVARRSQASTLVLREPRRVADDSLLADLGRP